jgi:hypothetical protein
MLERGQMEAPEVRGPVRDVRRIPMSNSSDVRKIPMSKEDPDV